MLTRYAYYSLEINYNQCDLYDKVKVFINGAWIGISDRFHRNLYQIVKRNEI